MTAYRRRHFLSILPFLPGVLAAESPRFGTFSIVARDPKTGELGVAVQSRVLAVGAIVPYARAGVGAVATQAYANPKYGPEALSLLSEGLAPQAVLDRLTSEDERKAERQLGIVSADGRSAAYTGEKCLEWAGASTGENFSVQGNILASSQVVSAMAESFTHSAGELGERLIQALEAGQRAGGDRRGQQSAALLIVREGWGYGGLNDRFRDLRVDDSPEPIAELRRIYQLHRRLFPLPE